MPDHKPKVEGSPPDINNTTSEVSARRLKKREIDRKCQRQARERTRSRIAYLESLVDNLQQPDGDERSAALMKRLAEVEKERDVLSHTLKGVQKAVFGLENTTDKFIKSDNNDIEHSILKSVDFGPSSLVRNNSLTDTSSPTSPPFGEPDLFPNDRRASQQSRHLSTSAPSDSTRVDVPTKVLNDACECCRDGSSTMGPPRSTWRFANTTLMDNYKRLSPILPEEDLLDEDIPIRVVLSSWDEVAQQVELPASWKIMRRLDEQMFSKAGTKERLATLTMLHMMLQYHREPTAERRARLPAWYLQRPSQTKPHAYATNYFVWPGVRERFVFEQHKYCSNMFATLFQTCLQILWPYDFRDCFAQRWDTGQYELSSAFREAINDISKWTMRPEFFKPFPDLRCDIPASYSSMMPTSNLLQLQLANHRHISTATSMTHTDKQPPVNDQPTSAPQMSMAESWMQPSAMVGWVDTTTYSQGFMDHSLQPHWTS